MLANRTGKSYEYRALCDSCGFAFWNYELRQRWDGLWVCKDDWEARHPSDFYRTRNDVHKLPFTRSDTPADPQLSWTTTSGITINDVSPEVGAVKTGLYFIDTLQVKTRAIVRIEFTKPSVQDASFSLVVPEPLSSTTSAANTITLPTTPTLAGTATIITSYGKYLGTATVAAGNATVTLPSWTAAPGHLTISALYGT